MINHHDCIAAIVDKKWGQQVSEFQSNFVLQSDIYQPQFGNSFNIIRKILLLQTITNYDDLEIHMNDFYSFKRQVKLDDLVSPFRIYLETKRNEGYNYFSLESDSSGIPIPIPDNSIVLVSGAWQNQTFLTSSISSEQLFSYELIVKDRVITVNSRLAFLPYFPYRQKKNFMVLKKV